MLSPKLLNISGQTITIAGKVLSPGEEYILDFPHQSILSRSEVTIGIKNGHLIYKDYKKVRVDYAIYIASQGGFLSLVESEKIIAACNFLVGLSDRLSVLSLDDQLIYGLKFHKASVEARDSRVKSSMIYIYNKLSQSDIQSMFQNPIDSMITRYINFGIEGTLEGNVDGLFDYLEARTGTLYETTGLSAQNYTPISGTLQDLVTKIMGILKDGNY
jgi:hypothetical protein